MRVCAFSRELYNYEIATLYPTANISFALPLSDAPGKPVQVAVADRVVFLWGGRRDDQRSVSNRPVKMASLSFQRRAIVIATGISVKNKASHIRRSCG